MSTSVKKNITILPSYDGTLLVKVVRIIIAFYDNTTVRLHSMTNIDAFWLS